MNEFFESEAASSIAFRFLIPLTSACRHLANSFVEGLNPKRLHAAVAKRMYSISRCSFLSSTNPRAASTAAHPELVVRIKAATRRNVRFCIYGILIYDCCGRLFEA